MTTSDRERAFCSHSTDETLALGRALGRAAEPGLVVALVGPLGAGKTHFVRGVAEGLETPDARLVSSPTFVLLQEYAGRLPIYHFDTYRLATADQFAALGAEEYFEADGVSLVEWADRILEQLPADRLEVRIEMSGATERRLRIASRGPRAARVLDEFEQQLAAP